MLYQYSTGNIPFTMMCPGYMNYSAGFHPGRTGFSKSEVKLINDMRLLWEQHIAWTRMTIISIVFGLPDVVPVTNRLLRNPKDFAAALKPFYGDQIASKFSDLLTSHLTIAVEVVKAAKAGDNKAVADAEKRWYANADDIAALLGSINPYWSVKEWQSMLYEHLALVKAQAVNMLEKKYAEGVAVYDVYEKQAMMMADRMAEGIIRQFPYNFMR